MLLFSFDVKAKVLEKLQAAEVAHPRVEEAFMALKWLLAKEPYKGCTLIGADPPVRLFKLILQYQSLSAMTVRYSVDKANHKIIIYDIRLED